MLLARRIFKAWRARSVHSALRHRQDLLMGLCFTAAHRIAWICLQEMAGKSVPRAKSTSIPQMPGALNSQRLACTQSAAQP